MLLILFNNNKGWCTVNMRNKRFNVSSEGFFVREKRKINGFFLNNHVTENKPIRCKYPSTKESVHLY